MSRIVIDAETRHQIESLVYEHAWIQDNNHEAARLADLYTDDGRFYGIEPERKGRAEILKYGLARTNVTDRIARHVCSNIRLTPMDNGRIQGNTIVTLFRHIGDGLGAADPCAVADAHDIYVKDVDGQWKIQERRLALIFESESHKAR